MKRILLLLMISAMSGCGKYPVWFEEQTADQAADAAWLNFSQKLYSDAETGFLTALEIDSSHISSNVGLGWVELHKDRGDLDLAARYLEAGMLNSIWKFDALCGLCVVKSIVNDYPLTITLADLLLSSQPRYSFLYDPDINWQDILILKIQAQYFTGEYRRAWKTIQELSAAYSLNPDETETWVVNGTAFITFEAALAKVIEELTALYSS